MLNMYTWPEAARLLTTFFLSLCVIAQTLALVLSNYRHPRGRVRISESLLEFSVLLQIFTCTLLLGQFHFSFELGMAVSGGYVIMRYAMFALTALFTIAVIASIKKAWPLSIIVFSAMTLPAVEANTGNFFVYIFLLAMLFWLMRGVHICILRMRENQTSLSVLSIKNAIDTLHSGVLFGETDGFILLHNRQMQRLMMTIAGKVRRNGWVFYNQLASGDIQKGCKRAEFDGQIVCLLPDESAWMFAKMDFNIKGKNYIQLTASDVTERWAMTNELQKQEDLLKQRSDELNEAILNINTLSRKRETQRAKMRAHDILGQRLSLMLRTIRSAETPGYAVLQTLSKGLMEDLKQGQNVPSAKDELEGLQQAFAAIGVTIEIMGELPMDELTGRLFVDIVRESVTNAVRHGFASKVFVEMEENNGYILTVTNNGDAPHEPISEGGGIGGMRRKVEPHGGVLNVATQPQFVLTVSLPGGGIKND